MSPAAPTRPRLGALLLGAALGACTDEATCRARVDEAHRVAGEDAAACTFAPDALVEPICSDGDRRPLLTYLAVWCAEADLGCLRADDEAYEACFGDSLTSLEHGAP